MSTTSTEARPRYRVVAQYVTYKVAHPLPVPFGGPVSLAEASRDGWLSPDALPESIEHLLSLGLIEPVELPAVDAPGH